jgi:hypothetical protein
MHTNSMNKNLPFGVFSYRGLRTTTKTLLKKFFRFHFKKGTNGSPFFIYLLFIKKRQL